MPARSSSESFVMRIDGRCHCGAIVYSAEVDPETAAICHCTIASAFPEHLFAEA
jgi:hypothetical protein